MFLELQRQETLVVLTTWMNALVKMDSMVKVQTKAESMQRSMETHKTETEKCHFTFHLFHTAQRVLESVHRSGLVLVSPLSWQVKL